MIAFLTAPMGLATQPASDATKNASCGQSDALQTILTAMPGYGLSLQLACQRPNHKGKGRRQITVL